MDSNSNLPEREQNLNPEETGQSGAYDEYDVAPAENVTNPNLEGNAERVPSFDFTPLEEEIEHEHEAHQHGAHDRESEVVYAGQPSAARVDDDGQQENAFQRFYEKRIKPLGDRAVQWVQDNPRDATIAVVVLLLLILGFIFRAPEPHVSLPAEPISDNTPRWLTNSLLTTFIVDIVIIVLALLATRNVKLIPTGWQNVMEMLIEYLFGLAESIAGKNARTFFPWVATIFIFVIISNWSGLIPGVGSFGFVHHEVYGEVDHSELEPIEEEQIEDEGAMLDFQIASADASVLFALSTQATQNDENDEEEVVVVQEGDDVVLVEAEEEHAAFVPLFRAPSADVNMTFALSLVTMLLVQFYGIRYQGANTYRRKFFTWHGPNAFMKGVNAFVGFLEFIAQFSRFLAFGFRLFGNVFAGEIVLATMAFLVAYLIPMPFYALEIFIGFVQALVFYMLALVFFTEATVVHGGEHAH